MKVLIVVVVILIPLTAGIVIKIGGLFDNNEDDSALVFRHAIDDVNKLFRNNMKFDRRIEKIVYGNELDASESLCKLIQFDVSAIFGPSSPSSASHCMNVCDAKEIPYIDVKWDADTKPPVINMHPHPDVMVNVFVDLIKKFEWEGFTIVYESAPWLKRLADLLELYDLDHTVTLRRLDVGLDKTNYRPVLRRVKLSGETKIVLDCSTATLPQVLIQAQQVGLMTEKHTFIITSMDLHTIDLSPYQHCGTNITGIRLVDPDNPMMEGITTVLTGNEKYPAQEEEEEEEEEDDDNLEKSTDPVPVTVQFALIYDGMLLLAEAFKQFGEQQQLKPMGLDCMNNEAWIHGNSITNFMRNTVVRGLTGEVKFDNRGYRTNFCVDVIELTSTGIVKVGTWDTTRGLNITRPLVEEDLTGSLKNKKFIVLITENPPYGMLKNSSNKLFGNQRYEGFGIDVIHELSLLLGFKYEFKLHPDTIVGEYDNDTKSWSGIIGELRNGKAHLAITDLTVTSERQAGVDFTLPFMNLGISILFHKPEKDPPSNFAFMSPFSTDVWLYLGGAYLGVSLVLFILGRISPAEWDNPCPCIEEPTELENQFSVSNALWFATGALLQQGSEIAPKAASTRTAATIWWFFTLIMVSSYTANLAAFLTFKKPHIILRDAEDLKDCADPTVKCPVRFGAKKVGATMNFFKSAEKGLYKDMYTYMQNHPDELTADNKEGEKWAAAGGYAYLMESSSIEYIVERNCNVTQVGDLLDEKGYAIAMRRNSSYRYDLSEAILRLQERGTLTALKIKWWKEKGGGGQCPGDDSGSVAEALSMLNMRGVFYVLGIGSAFATAYGIFEWLLVVFLRAKRQELSFKYELADELRFVIRGGGNTKVLRHHRRHMSVLSSCSHGSRNSADIRGSRR